MNLSRTTQLTLIFGCLLGPNVTFEGLRTLDASAGANDESFFRAAFSFHLRHNNSII
jgi:hypothetical protein